ncbi:hypothetical protein [Acetobacter estunensis]|uniref:hypothetical protein n=1 Tax=Acetobacter estunensis TaxID=104097 RepID=UPI001C2D3033|nr:hypothetical protein [Acetobacter estunensis]MBV1835653.1 hypothetical protein [Acetobacter estunensis]MBV1836086.1 hypothetical protein [Acetobacter estunensis]
MTLYRAELRELAAQALVGRTFAGEKVFTARSWPTTKPELPVVYLQVPDDQATSNGRNAPDFTRVATLALRGIVAPGTPGKCQLQLEAFAEQIELALMTDVALQSAITQVTEIRTSITVSSEGADHVGELQMLLGLEYIEEFPAAGTPLVEIDGTMSANGNSDFADFSVNTLQETS